MAKDVKLAETKSRVLSKWWKVVFVLGIVLLIYLFSIGPAYRMLRKGTVSQETFSTLYFPIQRLAIQNKFIDRLLMHYLLIWYSDVSELGKHLEELQATSNTNRPN